MKDLMKGLKVLPGTYMYMEAYEVAKKHTNKYRQAFVTTEDKFQQSFKGYKLKNRPAGSQGNFIVYYITEAVSVSKTKSGTLIKSMGIGRAA